MRVEVILRINQADFDRAGEAEGQTEFWRRAIIASGTRHLSADDPSTVNEMDRKFVREFPGALERTINTVIRDAYTATNRNPIPQVSIKFVSHSYGSLKTILDVAGIDSSSLADLVLFCLSSYSPNAFYDAMQLYTPLSVGVDVLDSVKPETASAPTASSIAAARTNEALNRAWLISNTSLVVPVILALGVCYYFLTALNHEIEASRTQATLAQAERSEIVKALQTQNAKLAELVAAHPANNDNFKAFTEILLAVAKLSDRPASPSRPAPNTNP